MSSFMDFLAPLPSRFMSDSTKSAIGEFFTGTPGRFEQRSTLLPEQMRAFQNLQSAARGPGAGGAFGESADYYRSLLSDNPQAYEAFLAPEMRRFREQTVPGIAEQFAGMGSGALSSSGFRNAAVSAGADLSERLAQIRAQLRDAAAQRLQGIGSEALGQHAQTFYRPRAPGFLESISEALAKGAVSGLTGGFGG